MQSMQTKSAAPQYMTGTAASPAIMCSYQNSFRELGPKTKVVYNNNNYTGGYWNRGTFSSSNGNNNTSALPCDMMGSQYYPHCQQFQMDTTFWNENNRMKRNYVQQRPQSQPRFVKLRGSKMNSHGPYRQTFQKKSQHQKFYNKNFINHNQPKGYKTVGAFSMMNMNDQQNEMASTSLLQRNVRGCHDDSSPSVRIKSSDLGQPQKNQESGDDSRDEHLRKSFFRLGSDSGSDHQRQFGQHEHEEDKSIDHEIKRSPVVTVNNLSYEDITENSDDNEDSAPDLREQLLRRKHEQVPKLEPGEIDSDDDDKIEDCQLEKKSTKSSTRGKKSSKCTKKQDVHLRNSTPATIPNSNRSFNGKNSSEKHKPGSWGKGFLLPTPSIANSSYMYHDDRCTPKNECNRKEENGRIKLENSNRDDVCHEPNNSSLNYCCTEAEITGLKDKVLSLKRVLRETRDKLLEANVIGSKKTLRVQEEVNQLKEKLNEDTKKEESLKSMLKHVENELMSRKADLARMTMLYEVEKQEKLKLEMELNRSYQDRLTIEIEKLRALFDVEVAKMQAFYISQTGCYEDSSITASFLKCCKRESGTGNRQQSSSHENEHVFDQLAGKSRVYDVIPDDKHSTACSETRPQQPLHSFYEVPIQSTSAYALMHRTASNYLYNATTVSQSNRSTFASVNNEPNSGSGNISENGAFSCYSMSGKSTAPTGSGKNGQL